MNPTRPSIPRAFLTTALILTLAGVAFAAGDRADRFGRFADDRTPAPTSRATTDPVEATAAVEATVVPAGPVNAAIHLAVDDAGVEAAERTLRVIAVLSNEGGAVDLATCPALFFDGTVRPIQGYAFVPGMAAPDCDGIVDHGPTLGLGAAPIPTGDPTCPASAPASGSGDLVTVPAADGDGPGVLVLQYDYLLADLGDGMEFEDEATILDRLRSGDGLALHTLTSIDPEQAALACPSGRDLFLAAAPPAELAALETTWVRPPVAATAGDVETASTLHSPASFGADDTTVAFVELEWTDNLDSPLTDVLTHDPEAGVEFDLATGEFATGTLTATFPDDLPEGFRGEAVIRVFAAGDPDDTLLSESRHPFVVDGGGPEIEAAETRRTEDDTVESDVVVSDPVSGLAGVRQTATVDGTEGSPALMDYVEGDFEGPTAWSGLVDPAAVDAAVGLAVDAGDLSGNTASATLPVAGMGPDATFECNAEEGADVELDGTLSTAPPESEAATSYTWTSDAFDMPLEGMIVDAFLPLGESDVVLTLEDDRGFTGTDQATYTVEDTVPPVIESVEPYRDCLWPPNHKYVRFELGEQLIVITDDVCDPDPAVRIVDVVSNQPDNGRGDGNTVDDAVFSDDVFCVRSERTGRMRDDRVYTVTVEVADASGNATTAMTTIRVPHDQSGHDCPAIEPHEFAERDWCDLDRIGQTEQARRMLGRGRELRESFVPPGQRGDRPVRGHRSGSGD